MALAADRAVAGEPPADAAGPVVVYVAGSGRSGSTLLERMLGMQDGCVNIGEVIELFRKVSVGGERCGCGRRFVECPFWAAVGDRAFGGWSPAAMHEIAELQRHVGRQRHVPALLVNRRRRGSDDGFGRAVGELGAAYARLYAAVAVVSGASVVVDASKWPGHGLALARSGAVDLRVLHLVRDVRGVAYSWSKSGVVRPHAGRDGGSDEGASGGHMATHPMGRTAMRWSAFQLECDVLRRVVHRSAHIRYEDLVHRPRPTLAKALTTLRLIDVTGDVRHVHGCHAELASSHGLAGNPSRFTSGPVLLRVDETWRTAMPARDRRTVTALALPVLLGHGYAPLRPRGRDR